MRRLSAVAISLLFVGVLAAGPLSASAHGAGIPFVGDRLGLYDPPATIEMAADTPFYVAHGNCYPPEGPLASLLRPATRFELYIDGTAVTMGTQIYFDGPPACPLTKLNYHNFHFGLPAGTYAFEAVWFDESLGEYMRTATVITFS